MLENYFHYNAFLPLLLLFYFFFYLVDSRSPSCVDVCPSVDSWPPNSVDVCPSVKVQSPSSVDVCRESVISMCEHAALMMVISVNSPC